jgi:restriction endonuclease S subunit
MNKLPSGWEWKKLGEVCEVIAGQSPEGKYYNSEGRGLPFYQGKKEFTDKFLGDPTTWTTEVTKEARKDDILMSVRAPVGPVNIATQTICIGRGLAAIRVRKNINRNYLFNFLVMNESEITGNSGAVFASINKRQIEDIAVPLPPLAEQKRIVAILDNVLESIKTAKENVEKNLVNAKGLLESYLNEIFSHPGKDWEEKKFGEIYDVRDGTHDSPKYHAAGYPLVTSKNLKDGRLNLNNISLINKSDYDKINERSKVDKGDILFAMIGTIGNPVIIKSEPNFAIKNVALFKVPKNQNKSFLSYSQDS